MWKIKKNIKQRIQSLSDGALQHAQKHTVSFGQKLRLGGRIRLANRWGRKHPKKLFACTIAVMTITAILGVLDNGQQKMSAPAKEGTSVAALFDGMRDIREADRFRRESTQDMISQGISIKHDLDSLAAIKEKTPDDSLQLYRKYKQLNYIVNFLNEQADGKN